MTFRIDTILLPEPESVLRELYGQHALTGRVVDVSNASRSRQAYAVVEVEGVSRPLLVPIDALEEEDP